MSFTMERSVSPSRNGFGKIFSKSSRDRRSRDSTDRSLKSSSSNDSHSHHGLQASTDDAAEKGFLETEDDSNVHGIKKLVPAMGAKRKRQKQEKEDAIRAREEAARGRSVAERGTLGDNASLYKEPSAGDGNSLITYDSDVESPLETPPPLTTRPSHAGYLTTSSPLIHSTIVPETYLFDSQADPTTPRAPTAFPRSFEALATSSSSSLPDNNLLPPTNRSDNRSPSPVGRLKQALTPRRASSPNTSPERKASGAVGAVPTNNKGFGTEGRRGSVASRIGSMFPDRQTANEQNTSASNLERPRTGKLQTIDTSVVPRTPPPSNKPAPIIVNTPPTPTDSGSPRFPSLQANKERTAPDPIVTHTNVVTSPSGNMISHRRVRSGSGTLGPSKLSNIISAPLTPTPENGSTTPGSGFFSSVFSAAQNAANTLSNSISNNTVAGGTNRSKSGTQDLKEVDSPVVETFAEEENLEDPTEEKELAVKTLGMGDLSLSHLGLAENSSGANTTVFTKFPEESGARADSAKEEPLPVTDNLEATPNDENQPLNRPRSIYEPANGERTPPNGSVFEGKTGIHRSGSIRSAIGNHRKRGSSAATGTTIGAAIAAANSSLANPNAGAPKITGFAVASKKRNRDFHQLFRSVPDDDYLIEDYSCALQREILAHGRLYVSEGHLCFSSNIFGWVTTLVMSFDEIVSVEKRSTALLFKNGLEISTLHAKNIFASFTSRDSTYDLIVGIWKLGHPSLRSSLNGVRLEETGGGDRTEKDDGTPAPESQSGSESESEGEDGDDIYDEDEEDEDGMSFTQADGSVAGSDIAEKVVSRKASAAVVANGASVEKGKIDISPSIAADIPGPATHSPTDCSDHDTHYAKIIADDVVQAPLGKIYSLVFASDWMRNWITTEQKCFDFIPEANAKIPLNNENKVRNYSYIKPLGGAIGPKQTKCICTETLDAMDLEKAVSVTISTQTPDVPSGNVFSTKTKYCFSWAEGNATRVQMNCAIEWTGKSWLKTPIEKGAGDGQIQHAKDLIASLRAATSSRRSGTAAILGKGKKKGRKGRESKSLAKTMDGASDTTPKAEDWGMLEPLHSILGPVLDIVKPLLTGNILYGIMVGLLVASWFRFGFTGRGASGGDLGAYFGTPERVAAYEEIWRREESELWDWLEDRVGMDRIRDISNMPNEAQNIQGRLQEESMNEREMDAAIRITEEKLKVLKATVEKAKLAAKRASSIENANAAEESGA